MTKNVLVRPRGDVRDFLRQISDRFHVIKIRRAVHQLVHLRFRGGDHLRVAMPGVDDKDTRETIQIFAAIAVRYGGSAGFVDEVKATFL